MKIMSLVMALILVSCIVSALPDIVEGIKVVMDAENYSATGDITNYVDGNLTTTAGVLNNVILEYSVPKHSQIATFNFRIAYSGESPMEYNTLVNSACLNDKIQIKQVQAVDGSGNLMVLTTSCFDGISWIVLKEISKTKSGESSFDGWYEESMSFWVSEKITPASSESISAGEVIEKDLGIIEEETSPNYAGIISQTKNSLTQYLSFGSVKVWEKTEATTINNFEVLATLTSTPDFLSIERENLFLESSETTIKDSTGIFTTYRCKDQNLNSGFLTDAINGTALLFVEASTPTEYFIFSIYDSTL